MGILLTEAVLVSLSKPFSCHSKFKVTLLLFFSFWGTVAFTQTDTLDSNKRTYSCRQLDLGIGPFPRIIVNSDEAKITIEYSGLKLAGVYIFSDTLYQRVDTLEKLVPEVDLFVDENQNPLIWKDISLLKPIEKEKIDSCLLRDEKEDEILLLESFEFQEKKGVLVVSKGMQRRYLDEFSSAHVCAPFFFDEKNCEYVNECGAIFWHELEKVFITNIIYNDFPVILAIEEKDEFGFGKKLRMIFNRIRSD